MPKSLDELLAVVTKLREDENIKQVNFNGTYLKGSGQGEHYSISWEEEKEVPGSTSTPEA